MSRNEPLITQMYTDKSVLLIRANPCSPVALVQQCRVPEPCFCSAKHCSFKRRSGGVVLLRRLPWSFWIFYVSLRRLRKSPTRK